MTIHHDKMAYGRIRGLSEDAEEEKLAELARKIGPEDGGKTEYEKMISGELYDPADRELSAMRLKVRRLADAYNRTEADEEIRRESILRQIFGHCGAGVFCEPPVHFDYGTNTSVGDWFYSNFNLVILDTGKVTIGKNCLFGPNVTIAAALHPKAAAERARYVNAEGKVTDREYAAPVAIGDDVWLGANVVVCAGVSIGSGTVIGAGSVVVRDIPSGVLAAGNPCRVIRPVTEEDRMLR